MDRKKTLKEISDSAFITLTDLFTGEALGFSSTDIQAHAAKVSDMPQRGGNMHDYMGAISSLRESRTTGNIRTDQISRAISSMRFFLGDYLETKFLAEENTEISPLLENYGDYSIEYARKLLEYNDRLEERLRASNDTCSGIMVTDEHHPRYVYESPEDIYEKVIEAKAQTIARAMKYAGLEK